MSQRLGGASVVEEEGEADRCAAGGAEQASPGWHLAGDRTCHGRPQVVWGFLDRKEIHGMGEDIRVLQSFENRWLNFKAYLMPVDVFFHTCRVVGEPEPRLAPSLA